MSNNNQLDYIDNREEQGKRIAMTKRIFQWTEFIYKVESDADPEKLYTVYVFEDAATSCNCADFQHRSNKDDRPYFFCKHMRAVNHARNLKTVIDARMDYKKEEYTF